MGGLLPGAADGDGGTQAGCVDAQGLRQSRNGVDPDSGRLALPHGQDGALAHAGTLGQGGEGQPDPVDEGVHGLGGAAHAGRIAEVTGRNQKKPLDKEPEVADSNRHVEKAPPDGFLAETPGEADQNPCEEPVMEATNTNIAAAEQTNAAFREAVERRAALRAAVEAEPVLLRPCAHCEEPISLMRVFAPYRDDLCDDCDSAEQERMSQDYEAERAADAPYHGRR